MLFHGRGSVGEAMRPVLDEIDARVAAARTRAEERGAVMRSPVLALGVSERVGSNWLSDLLRPVMVQHNEPLRQQIGAEHPLSALNPGVTGIAAADLGGAGHPCMHASTVAASAGHEPGSPT